MSDKKGPILVDEVPGVFAYCTCTKSANHPYCDGSHRGSGMFPVKVEVKVAKKSAICGCTHSSNKPYCDGTHATL
ncbi:MAG: CDGSH iron-sulfur domain-containing protein [Planctomycetes bacterium]|nr:CDGSH iron-sulfur domain-containing protein [Planctomycetota bacterium]